ncbi:hypothetical protein Zmor_009220 [Zophobas morio]|uniref:Uncharacterized protein n=1 Tax=Zophobas morio TaxID=2755281 RepID=A0AA38INX5_9CUCU|nr:hypothetical protein Zmor_009220 [Zophobas morio]
MELFPDDDRGLEGLLGPMAPRRRTKVYSWNGRRQEKIYEMYETRTTQRPKKTNNIMVKIPLSRQLKNEPSPHLAGPDLPDFRSIWMCSVFQSVAFECGVSWRY